MQQRPQKPPMPNWSGLSKNLALWLLVALLAVTLFQLMQKRAGGSEVLSYTEFSRQIDAGNIKAVEVYSGKEVRGEFRSPVAQGTGAVRNFTVNLPIANSEAILKRLEDAGVVITAKEPKSGTGQSNQPTCAHDCLLNCPSKDGTSNGRRGEPRESYWRVSFRQALA